MNPESTTICATLNKLLNLFAPQPTWFEVHINYILHIVVERIKEGIVKGFVTCKERAIQIHRIRMSCLEKPVSSMPSEVGGGWTIQKKEKLLQSLKCEIFSGNVLLRWMTKQGSTKN